LHTDSGKKKSAEEKFKEAGEAYEVLSDLDRRKKYDVFGHTGAGQAPIEKRRVLLRAARS